MFWGKLKRENEELKKYIATLTRENNSLRNIVYRKNSNNEEVIEDSVISNKALEHLLQEINQLRHDLNVLKESVIHKPKDFLDM